VYHLLWLLYMRPVNQPIVMGLELCKKCLGTQLRHHLPLGLHPGCLSTHKFSPFTTTVQQVKGKAIPIQALTGPEGSRRFRLPDYKTIGTWRWQGCQPYAPATFTPRKYSWYTFLLEAESGTFLKWKCIHIFHVERLMVTLSPQGQNGYTSESNSTHICMVHLNDKRDAWFLSARSPWWLTMYGAI
jgi:hypothetical protein